RPAFTSAARALRIDRGCTRRGRSALVPARRTAAHRPAATHPAAFRTSAHERRHGLRFGMARKIYCVLLKREAEGLDYLPYPGELGKRIYDSISKEGWAQWVAHQTMLINENRLTPIEPKARAFLVAEMEKFLFGSGSEKPKDFVPKEARGTDHAKRPQRPQSMR